jgi:uncharacterized protein (TIGR02145 family)
MPFHSKDSHYFSNLPLYRQRYGFRKLLQASTGAQNWRATIDDARISGTATLHPTEGRKYYKIVQMPDGKWWFAENVNFQKDLIWVDDANSPSTTAVNGVPGIGHFWCPGVYSSSRNRSSCDVIGALYTWETAMMVDGKYSDDTKANSDWVELTASYCIYKTDQSQCTQNAGRGDGNHGICPSGWHIPTLAEWVVMLNIVETGEKNIGTQIGLTGTNAGWLLKNVDLCNGPYPPCSADRETAFRYYESAKKPNNPYGLSLFPTGTRWSTNPGWVIASAHSVAQLTLSTAWGEHDHWVGRVYAESDQGYTGPHSKARGLPARCRLN